MAHVSPVGVVRFYRAKDVPEEILNSLNADNYPNTSEDKYTEFFDELQSYIYQSRNNDNYDNYLVAAYVDEVYVGGVMLFMNTEVIDYVKPALRRAGVKTGSYAQFWIDTPSPGIQGITRTRAAMNRRDFSLNFMLINAIKEFLRLKGVGEVWVSPVGPQKQLLLKHGFVETHLPNYAEGDPLLLKASTKE